MDDKDENNEVNDCPSAIFSQRSEEVYSILLQSLAENDNNDTQWISKEDLQRGWIELDELVEDGELLPSELDDIYTTSCGVGDDADKMKLDQKGFFHLYQLIDDLFVPNDDNDDNDDYVDDNVEDDYEDKIEQDINVQDEQSQSDNDDADQSTPNNDKKDKVEDENPTLTSHNIKTNLIQYLTTIHQPTDDDDDDDGVSSKRPCGFDCTDPERKIISDLIYSLESTPSKSNLVTSATNRGNIKNGFYSKQIMGGWNLRYTSSHTMIINQSLSGLGRSTSQQAQFQSLKKYLTGSKYLGKVKYVETFGEGDDDKKNDDDDKGVSFDVTVTGEWYVEERRHAFTGNPAPSLRVDPEKLQCGPMTNEAEQWSSLGPIKLSDFLYLDQDLMVLRGSTNPNALFVYERIQD